MAKADCWTATDGEARKCGEQTGLDTLVVHTVITDKDLSREGRSLLDGAGVEVITV